MNPISDEALRDKPEDAYCYNKEIHFCSHVVELVNKGLAFQKDNVAQNGDEHRED